MTGVPSEAMPSGRAARGTAAVCVLLAFLSAAGCGGDSSAPPPAAAPVPAPGPAPGPALSVSQSSLAFAGQAGGGNPTSASLSVANTGGGTLSWTASDNAPWLSVTPAGGTDNTTLTVSVDLAGLAAGTYGGAVTIASPGAAGSPAVVPVTLTVTIAPPPPVLSVAPGSLSFAGQAGGANPASLPLSVTNTGGETLAWAASDNATWLSVTPAAGNAPSTLTASVDLAGLAAGTYGGAITITSPGAAGSPAVVPVTLAVANAPTVWPPISFATVATGFASPVHVTHAGDGSGRIFVVEQAGRIRILDNGVVLPTPFLDIASRVASAGEQGLLSVAFPPGYAAKRYFYVYYTPIPGDNTVTARYRVTADNNIADNASETIVLRVPQPFANHNGGQLAFGPDGYLYIGKGDGGGGDPFDNGQRTDTLLGKILRIDVESGAATYAIPPDNPFVGNAAFLPEIWALGLRNPWRFSFDRGTGDLYIGDVGEGSFEEIDFQPAGDPGGRNYGWHIMEGNFCNFPGTDRCVGLDLPVFEYSHALGCSVTGGHVYRGSAIPSLQGVYLFADVCSTRIWGIRKNGAAWDNAVLADNTALTITTFGEDESGNVYVVNYATGDLLKIVP